jgi:3-oxoacyl-[acyl-carrier-protein] synthase II
VLEEREFALKRGATILGEVLGYGQSADATHLTAPDPKGAGAAYAMNAALCVMRGYALTKWITSTLMGPARRWVTSPRPMRFAPCFGSHADALAVSSTKSQLGHLLGASGGVESAFCITPCCDRSLPRQRLIWTKLIRNVIWTMCLTNLAACGFAVR